MGQIVVGLFGYYSHQNYGDNLMAFMLARYLKEQGFGALVYSTVAGYSDIVDAECESNLEGFVESVNFVVIGGGGLLVPHYRQPMTFDRELSQLVDFCAAKEKAIYALSIGGTGQPFAKIQPFERRKLIAACKYVTLRNVEELPLLEEAGVPGESFPDVVWCTSSFLPRKPKDDSEPFTIGVCLRVSEGRRRKIVDFVLRLLSLLHPRLKFVYLAVNPNDFERGAAVDLSVVDGDSSHHSLINLEQASDLLSSLDVLLTNKLHVGVAAMSYGVPVFAFGAEQKTKLLYLRLGLSKYFWGGREFHRLLLLGSRKYVRFSRAPVENLDKNLFQGAARHFTKLREIAQEYERTP